MTGEERVRGALRAYKEACEGEGAPERVEAALVAELRRGQAEREARGGWLAWPAWAAAAAVVAMAVALSVSDRAPAVAGPAQTDEVATEFFPLDSTADVRALAGAPTVRVSVPRTVMVSFGLPVNPERAGEPIEADVAIGMDGRAHAIRFIN